jgi:hypothetical protein
MIAMDRGGDDRGGTTEEGQDDRGGTDEEFTETDLLLPVLSL